MQELRVEVTGRGVIIAVKINPWLTTWGRSLLTTLIGISCARCDVCMAGCVITHCLKGLPQSAPLCCNTASTAGWLKDMSSVPDHCHWPADTSWLQQLKKACLGYWCSLWLSMWNVLFSLSIKCRWERRRNSLLHPCQTCTHPSFLSPSLHPQASISNIRIVILCSLPARLLHCQRGHCWAAQSTPFHF